LKYPAQEASELERRAKGHIATRLLPFLFILYIIAFLDRVNVGYAALEMAHDLSFSDRVFGLGAGIFFIGYLVFQIPGALIVERSSARRLLASILVTWGLVTILTAEVHTARQFYLVRFVLGIAEAGFFPGIVVYLTHWFRDQDRAKAVAIFMAAIPGSNIIGSPFAGWVVSARWFGVPGWRWLFIMEGIPAILFGLITWFYLTDRPDQAKWLPADEQLWIVKELQQESARKSYALSCTIWDALRRREVVLLGLAYFCGLTANYGFMLWFPTILKRATGLPNVIIGTLAIAPYLVALVVMIWGGWHSDRTSERRWHTAVPLLLAGAFLAVALVFQTHLWLAYSSIAIVGAGTIVFMPTFWALPTELLTAQAAAVAVGLINSCGAVGGFVGPFIVGYLSSVTKSLMPGLVVLLVALFLAGIAILCL
jgi:MFS transporter, ACS family, tartrate transporter